MIKNEATLNEELDPKLVRSTLSRCCFCFGPRDRGALPESGCSNYNEQLVHCGFVGN